MNGISILDANISAVIQSITKRLWLIILCALVASGIALCYVSFFVQSLYPSTATILVLNRTNDSDSIDVTDINVSTYLTKDYEEIITRRIVLDNVIQDLNLQMSFYQLRSCVSVINPTNTRMLDITVTTADPDLSKKIADSICKIASQKIVEIMKVEQVTLVDSGSYSTVPSNINKPLSMFLAALAGILLSTFVIVVHALMDDKIKTPDDVERYLGMSVIGTTPMAKMVNSENNSGSGSSRGNKGKSGYGKKSSRGSRSSLKSSAKSRRF